MKVHQQTKEFEDVVQAFKKLFDLNWIEMSLRDVALLIPTTFIVLLFTAALIFGFYMGIRLVFSVYALMILQVVVWIRQLFGFGIPEWWEE